MSSLKLSTDQDTGNRLNKLKEIIDKNFNDEIDYKQAEIDKITQRINETQNSLDKLRSLIICKYYSLNGKLKTNEYTNHPAIIKIKREQIDATSTGPDLCEQQQQHQVQRSATNIVPYFQANHDDYKQYKIKISIGNVSKYVNTSQTVNGNLVTHKWMVYIMSNNCKSIENYIKKVVYHLHESYRPNDVVEISKAPFQLIRRGWGECPVHVQVHFKDTRNKRLDIQHELKLDWTLTGLQTFGGETSRLVDLVVNKNDYIDTQAMTTMASDGHKSTDLGEYCHIDRKQVVNEEQMSDTNSISNSNSNSGFDLIDNSIAKQSTTPTNMATIANKATIDDLLNLRFNTKVIATVTTSPSKKFTSQADTNAPCLPTASSPVICEIKKEMPTSPTLKLINQQQSNGTQGPVALHQPNIKSQPRITQIASKASTSPQMSTSHQPNKKCVIYKVDSADLKHQTTHQPGHQVNTKPQQHRKVSTQTLTTISTVSRNHSSNTNRIQTKVLDSAGSSHMSSCISSSMSSGNSQQPLNNINQKSQTTPTVSNAQQIQTSIIQAVSTKSVVTCSTTVSTTTTTATVSNNMPSCSSKIYKINEALVMGCLCRQFSNYDDYIKLVIKNVPMFTMNGSNSKMASNYLPFCAPNAIDYFKWPFPKRKAVEWMRAAYIKDKIKALMIEYKPVNTHKIQPWSTKQILIWLRTHGHSLLDDRYYFNNNNNNNTKTDNAKRKYVCSLSPYTSLLLNKTNQINININNEIEMNNMNEYIDIVSSCSNTSMSSQSSTKQSHQNNLDSCGVENIVNDDYGELNKNYEFLIESSDGANSVSKQLDLLGIKTNPSNLTTNIACNLVEEFIFAICKHFCENLIRDTCSDLCAIHTGDHHTSSIRFPNKINVLDIFNTICKHDKYDFLTNKYMAINSNNANNK